MFLLLKSLKEILKVRIYFDFYKLIQNFYSKNFLYFAYSRMSYFLLHLLKFLNNRLVYINTTSFPLNDTNNYIITIVRNIDNIDSTQVLKMFTHFNF